MADQKTPVNQRAVIGEIIAKCWQDEGYKKSFLANPKKFLVEAGMTIPEKVEVKIVESTPKIMYAVLPIKVSLDILHKIMNNIVNHGVSHGLKLPEGGELRFIQNTLKVQYVVIPTKPAEGELTDADLELVAGGKHHHKDVAQVKTNVYAAVEAVAVEAAYTLTTAATNFEVAAEVAAVGAIVLV
ncbi:MAG: hypothetical protein A2008_08435 [Candidatus Wallbacteria bacterium GWC2_49_35]|uniref:Nitrile hydratase alpha/Thiocyanate hydrolase gamma domain-containing protein n=1 Tax=Candidatus Wallbacteria bacterium GWC2_49_35 TaxID=1817813 RepID=A0A1F7WNT1_9BACT|nr:MAG: hypothetical protein A2008_08435 [Candidatus Wallbacteria bacterium GWC2_49_35]HBC76027.1 hypothetical protein [Candidatus Wallbacteria bacterium]